METELKSLQTLDGHVHDVLLSAKLKLNELDSEVEQIELDNEELEQQIREAQQIKQKLEASNSSLNCDIKNVKKDSE